MELGQPHPEDRHRPGCRDTACSGRSWRSADLSHRRSVHRSAEGDRPVPGVHPRPELVGEVHVEAQGPFPPHHRPVPYQHRHRRHRCGRSLLPHACDGHIGRARRIRRIDHGRRPDGLRPPHEARREPSLGTDERELHRDPVLGRARRADHQGVLLRVHEGRHRRPEHAGGGHREAGHQLRALRDNGTGVRCGVRERRGDLHGVRAVDPAPGVVHADSRVRHEPCRGARRPTSP